MTITSVNVRNQFKGVVQEVVLGSVVSEINVETKAGIFTSIISTRSVQDLDLKVGSEVVVLIKSTEVSLAKL
jgi:molybdopterin-binding protein